MGVRKPYKTRKGYLVEYHPGHHHADNRGRVFAHIVAYENHTGVTVPDGYVVHHINGIKTDNRPENLMMMTSSEHTAMHNSMRKLSDETKAKMTAKAKERLSNPSNHPCYLSLDVEAIKADRLSGLTVKQICEKYNICKNTYYSRTEGYRRKNR